MSVRFDSELELLAAAFYQRKLEVPERLWTSRQEARRPSGNQITWPALDDQVRSSITLPPDDRDLRSTNPALILSEE